MPIERPMPRRQPRRAPPRLWMMTDERQGKALWGALNRLPRGAGVVFRHYSLPKAERRALFQGIERIARRRGLVLVAAGAEALASPRLGGVHNYAGRAHIHASVRTASAHNRREIVAAERRGADLVFLSPAFPTRSHLDASSLGPVRFGSLAHHARVPIIALGGMNAARGAWLKALGADGWAGIDAWTRPSASKG